MGKGPTMGLVFAHWHQIYVQIGMFIPFGIHTTQLRGLTDTLCNKWWLVLLIIWAPWTLAQSWPLILIPNLLWSWINDDDDTYGPLISFLFSSFWVLFFKCNHLFTIIKVVKLGMHKLDGLKFKLFLLLFVTVIVDFIK